MVGAGQGIGVAREIEDTPTSITLPYAERVARFRRIGMGKDPPSSIGALPAYLRSTAEEGVEVDFPEINQSDGTARTHMENIGKACFENIAIMEGGFAQKFENKFSKMDVEMIRTPMKDNGIIDDGTFSWDDVIISKMDGPEIKSAYLRANVMLLTNALTPITKRFSANSTGDYNLYLDSGASRHMVFDPALLINLRDPPSGTSQFRTADGSPLSVAAYGDIIMENFRILDVYLVHELTVNLISVGQLATDHKVSSCFAGNECNLMLSGGIQIGGAIRRDDNQYILRFLEIE